jgi:hypothetical protein
MSRDFYSREGAEKELGGPEEYREQVYDDSANYEVDIHDIGKYGGKWFWITARGCSCWSGEYAKEAGPFDTLDELRDHIWQEYGHVDTNYYKPLLDAWNIALDKAAQAA